VSLPRDVRDYACAVVGCSPERVTAVTRFEAGNRHAVHKVSYRDPGGVVRHVVVRVSHADDGHAEREAAVLEKVGGVGAPRLYDFRRASRWFDTPVMCLEFLPGDPRELNSAGPDEIEQLAAVVAALHRRPVGDLIGTLDAAGTVLSYARDRLRAIAATLIWARDPLPAALQTRLRLAAGRLAASLQASQETASFRAGESLVLLHGDVAFGNVLWGPEPALIDWEYTRLGDPADEIAYLFDQNALTGPQRQAFWDGYDHGSRLAQIVERVEWWEPLTLLGSTLWWVERWVRRTEHGTRSPIDPALAREPDYYLAKVTRRAERLERLLAASGD
jgi:aminoglycoside phosphotransferase (APT) family kinase protein